MQRLLFLSLLWLPLCSTGQQNTLETLLQAHSNQFQPVLSDPDKYRVQIIYTQIDRDENNRPSFTSHTFHLDNSRYFYPASTVKMPAALLALEKINKLQVRGLDRNATMITGAVSPPQTAATTDSTAANGLPSMAHYIKKIFVVSDNDAFNRLYEYLGQEYLTRRLWEKGYNDTRIIHRLSAPGFNQESNRLTNPVSFYKTARSTRDLTSETLLYHQGEVYSKVNPPFMLKDELQGTGYINGAGELIQEPFDFRQRNFFSLRNLHDMVRAVMFPDDVPEQQKFRLTDDDYAFVRQCMSMLPRESDYPTYPEKDYPDGYVKFLMFGDTEERIPDYIRIYNKVGNAYGYLTDAAYIVDYQNQVEFLLAATIHVNDDGIFNDGKYEYKEIGYPFLANLGKVIYDYELRRYRKNKPVLNRY